MLRQHWCQVPRAVKTTVQQVYDARSRFLSRFQQQIYPCGEFPEGELVPFIREINLACHCPSET